MEITPPKGKGCFPWFSSPIKLQHSSELAARVLPAAQELIDDQENSEINPRIRLLQSLEIRGLLVILQANYLADTFELELAQGSEIALKKANLTQNLDLIDEMLGHFPLSISLKIEHYPKTQKL